MPFPEVLKKFRLHVKALCYVIILLYLMIKMGKGLLDYGKDSEITTYVIRH